MRVIALIGLLAGYVTTLPLWLGETPRSFPPAPLLHLDPSITRLDIWGFLLFPITVFSMVFPRRCTLCVVIISFSFLILLNTNRLQPYTFQYLLMLLVLCTKTSGSITDVEIAKKSQITSSTILVILSSVWFWSGIQKINLRFFEMGVPWFAEPALLMLPEQYTLIVYLGVTLAPIVETTSAILLLFPRTRSYGAVTLVLMHISILLILGPLGRGFNSSVWSWNLAMIGFLVLIHRYRVRVHTLPLFKCSWHWRTLLQLLVIGLSCAAPLLNFFHRWPDYLSHSLYSWATMEGRVYVRDTDAPSLFLSELPITEYNGNDNRVYFDLDDWSYATNNSPSFPHEAGYRLAFQKLCGRSTDLELALFDRVNRLTGERRIRTYRCQDASHYQ